MQPTLPYELVYRILDRALSLGLMKARGDTYHNLIQVSIMFRDIALGLKPCVNITLSGKNLRENKAVVPFDQDLFAVCNSYVPLWLHQNPHARSAMYRKINPASHDPCVFFMCFDYRLGSPSPLGHSLVRYRKIDRVQQVAPFGTPYSHNLAGSARIYADWSFFICRNNDTSIDNIYFWTRDHRFVKLSEERMPVPVQSSSADYIQLWPVLHTSLLDLLYVGTPCIQRPPLFMFRSVAMNFSIRVPKVPSTWPYRPSDFIRVDESSDGDFYSMPRFVTHIDDRCIAALSQYYQSVLPDPTSSAPRILDLASSWISHLPESFTKTASHVIGLGMNAAELRENPVLSSTIVRDLNTDPSLQGVDDNSVDAVVCSVSIDYLNQPRSVMAEIARAGSPRVQLSTFSSIKQVLKPGASAHMTFSNRCFPTKAIGRWLRVDENERCNMVANYFAFAGNEKTVQPSALFDKIEILDILKRSYTSDPLYCVRARKASNHGHGEL